MQKGSSNYRRQRMKIAKIHADIANIRADFLHKLTAEITDNADHIVIEDLDVKKMLRIRV
jgi:putative transposase